MPRTTFKSEDYGGLTKENILFFLFKFIKILFLILYPKIIF